MEVPNEWVGQEVWLRWDSQTEAMLWNEDGEPLQVFTISMFFMKLNLQTPFRNVNLMIMMLHIA